MQIMLKMKFTEMLNNGGFESLHLKTNCSLICSLIQISNLILILVFLVRDHEEIVKKWRLI